MGEITETEGEEIQEGKLLSQYGKEGKLRGT